MRVRAILFITTYFICLSICYSANKEATQAGQEQLVDKRLTILEEKITQNDQFYKELLESQRQSYSTNITIFISLTTIILGLTGLINFGLIKKELKTDVNKARNEIKKEFVDHIEQMTSNLEKKVNEKFYEFKGNVSNKIIELTGDNYNALGRIYKENNEHSSAAVWFARAIREYVNCPHIDDSWIKLHIDFLKGSLRAIGPIGDSERIAEYYEIISSLDDKKFKSEKEELQKILDSKIKPVPLIPQQS
ncbi:MAG: hypothetical protein Q7K71_01545 [Candidatus Omnitrophota bacterium]|nr:hypothetical protein [Candidatus Omnitrophota bacterium]